MKVNLIINAKPIGRKPTFLTYKASFRTSLSSSVLFRKFVEKRSLAVYFGAGSNSAGSRVVEGIVSWRLK